MYAVRTGRIYPSGSELSKQHSIPFVLISHSNKQWTRRMLYELFDLTESELTDLIGLMLVDLVAPDLYERVYKIFILILNWEKSIADAIFLIKEF